MNPDQVYSKSDWAGRERFAKGYMCLK